MTRINTHLRTNIVGYVALFIALSTGAYAAALAPDSVRTKHIKNGQVKNPDLATDAVTGANVAPGSLGGEDLRPGSVGGLQIAESTLGEVPNATIAGHGGYGRSAAAPLHASCDPESGGDFETCASVGLTPSAPGRAWVIGTVQAISFDDELDSGRCRLGVSSTGGIPGTSTEVFLSEQEADTITISGVTAPLAPGNYSFGIDCDSDDDDLSYNDAQITAVMISPF